EDAEIAVFALRDDFVQEMHAERHEPGDDARHHHPAALPEKNGVLLVIDCRRSGGVLGGHDQGCELRNRTSMSEARSSERKEIHSSGVCAWAMSPGPNTTLGMPPAARMAASQK